MKKQLAKAYADRCKAAADWNKAFGQFRQAKIDMHTANLEMRRANAESERIQALINQGVASMKYRKKPVVVEAVQWFKMGDHPAVLFVPLDILQEFKGGYHGWIQTLEGGHIVTPGDYIVTGVMNEVYPCKPDIFAMTYEPVGEQE